MASNQILINFSILNRFVPSYVYNDHQEWILLQHLNNNETTRQTFIDAYTVHSDTNWTDYWYTVWNTTEKIEEYLEYGFSLPNTSLPIIWGSSAHYAMCAFSQRLVDNVLGGLNWSFVALGSEGELTNLVQDLYAKQLPFIANIYSPHLDFATILENETEYMEFERIALPRNPNNDVDSECYSEGTCTFPITPMQILANPNLTDTFPEMYDFALDFEMSAADVNTILSYRNTLNESMDLSGHEKWQYAACQWLKLNSTNSTTSGWYQDITRYDCIFENSSNCGFDYFYNSYDDAVNGQNAVNISWDDSIAGDCAYDPNEPLCECLDEYFVGDSCRTSCPGVIGPILNDNYDGDYLSESRFVSSENYTFYLCSGHGTCVIDNILCECEDGYGGDGCQVEYEVFVYDTAFMVIFSILFGICIVVLLGSMYWVYLKREFKTIRAMSPTLVYLFTVGMIIFTVESILYLFHPMTDAICIVREYVLGVGGTFHVLC